jgi:hypothetical protein
MLLAAVIMALAAGAVVYGARFKSTWKAPDVDRLNFPGRKVAAVVISKDEVLQASTEEELARQWFGRSAVHGLVVMRVVGADKEVTYSPTCGCRRCIPTRGTTTPAAGARRSLA